MPLPDNYFQSTPKPYAVQDEDLDEMVNAINSNQSVLTNVSTGHNHNGSNSRKIKQVANINLSKVCASGSLNRVAFNIDFITPEAGGVTIFMNVQKTLGFTVDNQNGASQVGTADVEAGNHTGATGSGTSHVHSVSKSNIAHTHSMNAHTHQMTNHKHSILLGTNAGDFAVYFDNEGGVDGSYLTKGIGVAKTAYTSNPTSLPNVSSVASTMNSGEPASNFNTEGESSHTHSLSLSHTIWDNGHTHNLNHNHDLTDTLIPTSLPTPTFTLDPDTTPHSLPYNPTSSSPVESSWFTSGVHYIGISVSEPCEVSISIWIRGLVT